MIGIISGVKPTSRVSLQCYYEDKMKVTAFNSQSDKRKLMQAADEK